MGIANEGLRVSFRRGLDSFIPVLVPILIPALLAIGLAGCTTQGPSRPASDEERQRYTAAVNLSDRDPAAGASELEAFVIRYPESGLADDAAYRLAELALEAGDEEAAIRWLRLIVRDYPGDSTADSARLLLAGMESQRGDLVAARRLLSRIDFERLAPSDRRLAYRLLADLSIDPVDSLEWRIRERRAAYEDLGRAVPDPELAVEFDVGLADLDLQIASAMDTLTDEELEDLADRLDGEPPAGRVLLLRARRDLVVGDFGSANRFFKRARRIELDESDASLYAEVEESIRLRQPIVDPRQALPTFAELAELPLPSTRGAAGTLGVVLPLSGRFAEYGEESLRGIMLAANIFAPVSTIASPDAANDRAADEISGLGRGSDIHRDMLSAGEMPDIEAPPRSGLRIVVRDSQGTAEGAVRAVRELAAEEDLVAIVGPLLGATAAAAAVEANFLEVPMLALTSREEVPRERPYVFRFRTTPDDEIRALVDHAAGQLGARRFAVLYPKDVYGRRMRDHFWQAVEDHGGFVVASSGYDPNSTDFADPIRRMIGYSLLSKGEEEALEHREALMRRGRRLEASDAAVARSVAYRILGPKGEPLPPRVDFDALFIPDSHDKVVLIAPQLTFHEVGGVVLLGTGDWVHEDLVRIGREHVKGSVISAPFDPESRFPFVSEFVEDYSHTFEGRPDVFSAHGYDVTRLVLVRLARQGPMTRDEVQSAILHTQAYPGASGVISVMPDGNARKRPFLLEVKRNRIVSLD